MSEAPSLLAVVGATATGKTELAAALAERLGGEVLCCDASSVYRGLDIGTAKPGPELRARVPHRLLDLVEPGENFTAASWLTAAEKELARLGAASRPAVIAGGTFLYLRLLLRGLSPGPAPDAELRTRLAARERARPGSLHRILSRLDPAEGKRLFPADLVRIERSLEHRLKTGRRASADRREWTRPPIRSALRIGLRLPRAERELRIRARVDRMLAEGLWDEVRGLLEAGVDPASRAMRAIGYREAAAHLRGELSPDEARERIVVATRRYAKRQDTWLRREPDLRWFDAAPGPEELPALIESVMMTLPSTFRLQRTESRGCEPPSQRSGGARDEEPRP